MDLLEMNECGVNRHPWEIARAESVLKLLKNNPREAIYADIGAGDLFFARKLAMFSDNPVYIVDKEQASLKETDNFIVCREINRMPENTFDCIILMDVLEHAKNDNDFLEDALRALKDNGKIVLTLPAHSFLFCQHDIFLRHYRRYDRGYSLRLFKRHNLVINENFYFYTVPFIIRCLQVMLFKLGLNFKFERQVSQWKFRENNFITSLVAGILLTDFFINRFLSRFGFILTGLSLYFVCQKERYVKKS